MNRNQVLSGIRDYSIKYFLPELRDELVGYVSEKTAAAAFSVIGALREREFTIKQLEIQAAHKIDREELEQLLGVLFECSALGNIQTRSSGNTYFTFKYRNRNSSVNLSERLILHRGVWKAMNLI